MKKAFKVLLILGCVAALAACSKEEDPAVLFLKAGQHTISLGVDERPDTRVSYSHQKGESVYRFSWSEGDAIGVYIPGRETPVRYTIADGVGGKKATFTLDENCSVPLGQQTVSIFYPYSTNESIALPQNMNTCDLENLGNYAVLYAKEVPMMDGEIGDAALKHATSYLHFPAGFKFFKDKNTLSPTSYILDSDNNTSGTLETPYRVFNYKNLEPTLSNSSTTLIFTLNDEGKLEDDDDIYIPFFVPEAEEGVMMQLKWSMVVEPITDSYSNATYNNPDPPQKAMKPGKVYKATNEAFPIIPINFEAVPDNIGGAEID